MSVVQVSMTIKVFLGDVIDNLVFMLERKNFIYFFFLSQLIELFHINMKKKN